MPIVVVALIIALVGGTGVIQASQDATPDSPLYAVRQLVSTAEPLATKAKTGQGKREASKADRDATDEAREDTEAGALPVATVPVTETKWYSHTISAITAVTGTTGLTLTRAFSDVVALAGDSDMPGQSYRGLAAKLRAVAASIDRGQGRTAGNQLEAFLNQLQAAHRAGKIDQAQYDQLYADYSELSAALKPVTETDAEKHKPASSREKAKADEEEPEEADEGGPERSDKGKPEGTGQGKAASPAKDKPATANDGAAKERGQQAPGRNR